MEHLGFAPDVFAAAIDHDLILFDARADRYVALPGALREPTEDGIDMSPFEAPLAREAASALLAANLLTPLASAEPAWRPMPKPSRALPTEPHGSRGSDLVDVARLAIAVMQTRRRLAGGLPCAGFSRARRRPPVRSTPELVQAVGRLAWARLLVPHPRRCLPASVVSALFLRRLGHPVEIVFGVRSHPFEAHSWIEADGIVLDDDLDRVRAFTPIATASL